MRLWVRSLVSLSGSGVATSCGTGHRHSSDPALLWLWYRLAATAPICLGTSICCGCGPKKTEKKKKKYGVEEVVMWTLIIKYFPIFLQHANDILKTQKDQEKVRV